MQNIKNDFETLLERIRRGDSIESAALLPYLSLEHRDDRCQANYRLAEAYAKINDFQQAKVFISRAWVLSRFSPDILPLYLKIHSALNDIDSIREAYKRLGMLEASKNNVAGALKYFNLWQYAFANHQKLDKYAYDFDILERIQQMAEPWRFREYFQANTSEDRKIKIAYLIFGMTHLNSVLVKINCILAKYHDKGRFEIVFFVPDPKSSIHNSTQAKENIKLLRKYDCEIIMAPYSVNDLKRLLAVAQQIYDYKPDILITSALLAEFEHYFIASLQPATCIVGLLQGPPSQFAAPSLDWSISWSKHPLIDSPCDCSLVHIGLDLPDRISLKPYSREDLGLPQDSQILMSAGRHVKFQNPDVWKSILDILSRNANVYYVAVGVSKEEVPFLEGLMDPALADRVRLLGWREDCLDLLCLADLIIDTYPSGGGHVLIDAMALAIPFVSFENNYMKMFDQTDWSVADEFVAIPELIVKRGDFEQFKRVVAKLVSDRGYREKMGKLCKEQIHMSMGNPEKGVRLIENLVLRIIAEKMDVKKGVSGPKVPHFLKHVLKKLKNPKKTF